MVELVVYVQRH